MLTKHWTEYLEHFQPNMQVICELSNIRNLSAQIEFLENAIEESEQEIENLVSEEYAREEITKARVEYSNMMARAHGQEKDDA